MSAGAPKSFFPLSVAQQPQNKEAGQQMTCTLSKPSSMYSSQATQLENLQRLQEVSPPKAKPLRIWVNLGKNRISTYSQHNCNSKPNSWSYNLHVTRILICSALDAKADLGVSVVCNRVFKLSED